MKRVSWVTLSWSLGAALGGLSAVLLGPFAPGWGMVVGVPATTLVFMVGLLKEPGDLALPWALRILLSLTLGFVAVGACLGLPVTGEKLNLLAAYVGTASMLPFGGIALARRARRLRKSTRATC